MQSVTPRVTHSWSVKGYPLTKYSGHSLKGRLEWRETGCREHGQECVQGNKSNARIWGDLENGSGVVRDIAQLGYAMPEAMQRTCRKQGGP